MISLALSSTMGSQHSRTVRRRVEADASANAPAHHDIEHANAPRQEPAPPLPALFSHDDISAKFPIVPSTVLPRRNSAPAPVSAITATAFTRERVQELTADFSLFLAERCLMSIELPDEEFNRSAVATVPYTPAPQQPSNPLQESDVRCLFCCTALPNEKDDDYIKKVVRPCKSCDSACCGPCLRRMFIEACTDTMRMPPRCCVPIQLRYARPHMTKEEITVFKLKYEEWQTPNPFYCPVPTCSTFISERLLPDQTEGSGKRTDSGVGIPTSKTFTCPACEASICLDCRQVAHPCSACNISEFGIDEETTKLLKSWGYKQCPKCRHGLKRMYGCNHMECRCGAHFCYVCLGDPGFCAGDCGEGESDYESDRGSVTDSLEPHEAAAQPTGNGASSTSDQGSHAPEEHRKVESHNALLTRPRNLDGGGSSYWESQSLDFGDEPGEDPLDSTWNCSHHFNTYKIDFAEALVRDSSDDTLECMRCWCTIYPEIRQPRAVLSKGQAKTISMGSRVTGTSTERVISRRYGRGRRQRRYVPPHSLFRADATMGAALYRTRTASSLLSQSVPDHAMSYAEAEHLNHDTDRVVDIYGNIIFSAEPEQQRRASMDDHDHHVSTLPAQDLTGKSSPSLLLNTASTLSNVFTTPNPQANFAYECLQCSWLVCVSCRDAVITAQNMKNES
jgi:hypothetical protein